MTPPCPGCGALVPGVDGPVHPYVVSSPGCWQTLGEVQANESLRFGYPPAHRLVVDAYMAQHPGDGRDRRDRQSVFVHLAALCAVLEHGVPSRLATDCLRRVLRSHSDFPVLERRAGAGALNVLHVTGRRDLAEYERRAREWAGAVWSSWEEHHPLIRAAVSSALS